MQDASEATRCGLAPASRRAAISVSADVRMPTTTAWAHVPLEDHYDGQAVICGAASASREAPRTRRAAQPGFRPRRGADLHFPGPIMDI